MTSAAAQVGAKPAVLADSDAGVYVRNKARSAFRCVATVAAAVEVQLAVHAQLLPPAPCRLELLTLPPGPVQWGAPAPVRAASPV